MLTTIRIPLKIVDDLLSGCLRAKPTEGAWERSAKITNDGFLEMSWREVQPTKPMLELVSPDHRTPDGDV